MKKIDEMTEEELGDWLYSDNSECLKILADNKRRQELAKTDLTYLDYPSVSVSTGEIVGYPFEGWSKEEIEEYFDNYDVIIKDIFK